MKFQLHVLLAAFMLVLGGTAANAQPQLPEVPGAKGQAGSQDMSSAAKNALNNIKSARSNIGKKDYATAKTDISSARENLKALKSGSGVGQVEGMTGGKAGASPFSSADKQLGNAEQALNKNQPKVAESQLQKAEGLLSSTG
ncbi:MAG: hypothetical protein ACJ763_20220 [Bdellovibrionia bacterium]